MNKAIKHFAFGGLAGQIWDLTVGGPVVGYATGGIIPALNIRDSTGEWVWGIGLGDITTFLAGGAITLYGDYKKKENIKNFGLGWMAVMGLVKLAELGGYINKRAGVVGGWDPSWVVPLETEPLTTQIVSEKIRAGPPQQALIV